MSFEMDRIRHIGDVDQPQWGAMSKLTFTTKVMPMFGVALFVTAMGAYLARGLSMPMLLGIFVAELVLVFTSGMWQRKEGLNKVLFFVYAALSGATLVPLLTWAGARGGIMLISQALTVTTITFAALAVYGMTTKRDFTNLGGYLFMGAIAMIAAGLLNAFVFKLGVMSLLLSVLGTGLFAAFTVYDMSNIRRVYQDEDYVGAALSLYISFIGLFTHILRMFGLFGGNNDD